MFISSHIDNPVHPGGMGVVRGVRGEGKKLFCQHHCKVKESSKQILYKPVASVM